MKQVTRLLLTMRLAALLIIGEDEQLYDVRNSYSSPMSVRAMSCGSRSVCRLIRRTEFSGGVRRSEEFRAIVAEY